MKSTSRRKPKIDSQFPNKEFKMEQKIFVTPAEGKLVKFPELPTRILSSTGEYVPASSYWIRRLNDGDVIIPKQEKGDN